MIPRLLDEVLSDRLSDTAAVVLTGPRQVGKTTLALAEASRRNAIYLDLESPQDLSKLSQPELYLQDHLERLVILDEVHRTPDLSRILRGMIDRARQAGRRTGLYLLLGSASLDLLQQSGESLAGRVTYLELTPFTVSEIGQSGVDENELWTRGGFPESLLAADANASLRWRNDFLRTYLERDIPQLGSRVPAETLRRLWTMLAHRQGSPANAADLARNLGLDARTVAAYVDLLVDLLLVRRLPPWSANVGKRLVKSPRLFVRDTGLLHALLGIGDRESLLSHPVVGASWEGFAIENLLANCSPQVTGYYYRTSGGAEIDLLLLWPGGKNWAVEVKRSLTPVPARGFHEARQDLRPERSFVVYPGTERFPVGHGVTAIPLVDLARELQSEE